MSAHEKTGYAPGMPRANSIGRAKLTFAHSDNQCAEWVMADQRIRTSRRCNRYTHVVFEKILPEHSVEVSRELEWQYHKFHRPKSWPAAESVCDDRIVACCRELWSRGAASRRLSRGASNRSARIDASRIRQTGVKVTDTSPSSSVCSSDPSASQFILSGFRVSGLRVMVRVRSPQQQSNRLRNCRQPIGNRRPSLAMEPGAVVQSCSEGLTADGHDGYSKARQLGLAPNGSVETLFSPRSTAPTPSRISLLSVSAPPSSIYDRLLLFRSPTVIVVTGFDRMNVKSRWTGPVPMRSGGGQRLQVQSDRSVSPPDALPSHGHRKMEEEFIERSCP